jgi:hypothetical protein
MSSSRPKPTSHGRRLGPPVNASVAPEPVAPVVSTLVAAAAGPELPFAPLPPEPSDELPLGAGDVVVVVVVPVEDVVVVVVVVVVDTGVKMVVTLWPVMGRPSVTSVAV